jgi:hypothetical protein
MEKKKDQTLDELEARVQALIDQKQPVCECCGEILDIRGIDYSSDEEKFEYLTYLESTLQ